MAVSLGDRAVRLFDSGLNCAESVLAVLSERLGKRGKHCGCAVPPVATGFCCGIGRNGSTCGALSGVALAVGLAVNRKEVTDVDKKNRVYDLVSTFISDFEGKFGSSLCTDLTGFNMNSKEERLKYRAQRVQDKKCSKYVKWCAEYGTQLIDSLSR